MRNKASLLLMEQLIMILVFALAAAVCLQGFAYAAQVSREICMQEEAVFLAQGAAEELKAAGEASEGLYFYDDALNPVGPEENWCYRLEVKKLPQEIDGLGQAQVQVENGDSRSLASLTVGWKEG